MRKIVIHVFAITILVLAVAGFHRIYSTTRTIDKGGFSEASYIVWQYNSTHYAARNMSTNILELLDENDDYVIQYAIDQTEINSGSIFIKAGSYNASLVLRDKVRLVIDKGATGVAIRIDSGATCFLENYNSGVTEYYVSGALITEINHNTGIVKTSTLNASQWWHGSNNRTDVLANPLLAADFIVYKERNYYKVKNCTDQNILWTETSPSTIIQNALNYGGLIYIKNATYNLDIIPLNITVEYTRITGSYPKMTVSKDKMTDLNHALVNVKTSHVEIDHLIIDGNGSGQNYAPDWGMDDGLISVCKYAWNTPELKTSSREEDVKIHDCVIKNAYYTGIAVNKFDKVKIYDNIIRYSHSPHKKNIHVTWSCDSEIRNNFCDIYPDWVNSSNNIMLFPAGVWTDVDTGCKRVTIQDNICWHSHDSAIEANGGQQPNTYHEGIKVESNIVWGRNILYANNLRDSSIIANIVMMDSGTHSINAGIAVALAQDVNSESKCDLRNILICSNIVYKHSKTYNCDQAISVGGVVRDIEISHNIIHNVGFLYSTGEGIRVLGDNVPSPNHLTRVRIIGNKIHNCSKYGIRVLQTVAEAEILIENNEIYNNGKDVETGYGIAIESACNAIIRTNHIYDDKNGNTQDRGISIESNATYGSIISNRIRCATGLYIGENNDNWFVDGNDFYGCTTDVDDNSGGTTVYGGNRSQKGSYVHGSEP